MKKILTILLFFVIAFSSYADRTFSFGQISTWSPQTGLVSGGGMVIAITIGDGYIQHPMYGTLYEAQTNMDGSTTYLPSGMAGTPFAQLQGVLISADLQRMEEHLTSSYGGMTLQMINTYTNAGEDGGRYAHNWSNAQSASRRGGYSGNNRSDDPASCSACGGTGVSKTPNSGGSRSNWVAYYNSTGTKCPYCKGYTSHFHDRCGRCNVPSY